jgi:hypothetical protein
MNYIVISLVITLIFLIIELKFRPRVDTIEQDNFIQIILRYSIKSKIDRHLVVRDYIPLFKIPK